MSTVIDDESVALTHFSNMSEASKLAALEKEVAAEVKRQEEIVEDDRRRREAEATAWDRELEEIADNERWEAKFVNIPIELQPHYAQLFETISSMYRIAILKLLDSQYWELGKSIELYKVLLNTPTDKILKLIDLLRFVDGMGQPNGLNRALSFLQELSRKTMAELMYHISEENFFKLFEISRHLDVYLPAGEKKESHELAMMIRLINYLGFNELLKILDQCEEPAAKMCRLCKTKRLQALEFKMINNQKAPGFSDVDLHKPFLQKDICGKPDIWQQQDEKEFTFDTKKRKVYWRKQLVDINRICTECISDVYGALTNNARFDSIHHMDTTTRKEFLAQQKKTEEETSEFITFLSIERERRRAREWACRALDSRRHGLRLERDEVKRKEDLLALQKKVEAENLEKQNLYDAAKSVDKKWLQISEAYDAKYMKDKVDLVDISYHLGFSEDRPVPTDEHGKPIREAPYSWNLQKTDANGVPISPEQATVRFGVGFTYEPENHFDQLSNWKEEALTAHELFLKDQEEIAARKKAADDEIYNERIAYVQKRLRRIDRKNKLLQRQLEQEEENRLEKRAAERLARKALRIAGYEAAERVLMEVEDVHSRNRQFYEFEQLLIFREREAMFEEEIEQRAEDNFWGLDNEELRRLERIATLKKFYEDKQEYMRQQLILTKAIRPFVLETKMKCFRDPLTGEVLK